MKLLSYAARRVLLLIPVLLGLLVLTFVIARVIPTDPTTIVAGQYATEEQRAALAARYGLNDPLPAQLVRYGRQLLAGDLGTSLFTRRPVVDELGARLPATLELAAVALVVAVVGGVPLGVVAALRRDSWLDHLLRTLTIAGLSIASFWLGILLQLLFSMHLQILPLGGRISVPAPAPITGFYLVDSLLQGDLAAFGSSVRHLILPATTLALSAMATIVRFTRAGVLAVLHSEFVHYQRAMGLPERLIVWKYLLRNGVTSTITQVGLLIGNLIVGAVVVESIFTWPGIGYFTVRAILVSDYPVILGTTLLAGLIYSAASLVVDLLNAVVDPRERVT